MGYIECFNYKTLDAETRIVVQQRTSEISSLMKRTAESIIEIGEKLADVKARLEHGQFCHWLDSEFSWTIRTAQIYMNVAKQFGGKNENFSLLAPSALYALAAPSTPEEAREEALEAASQGEHITHKRAKEIVERHREPTKHPEPTEFGDGVAAGKGERAEVWEIERVVERLARQEYEGHQEAMQALRAGWPDQETVAKALEGKGVKINDLKQARNNVAEQLRVRKGWGVAPESKQEPEHCGEAILAWVESAFVSDYGRVTTLKAIAENDEYGQSQRKPLLRALGKEVDPGALERGLAWAIEQLEAKAEPEDEWAHIPKGEIAAELKRLQEECHNLREKCKQLIGERTALELKLENERDTVDRLQLQLRDAKQELENTPLHPKGEKAQSDIVVFPRFPGNPAVDHNSPGPTDPNHPKANRVDFYLGKLDGATGALSGMSPGELVTLCYSPAERARAQHRRLEMFVTASESLRAALMAYNNTHTSQEQLPF